MKSRVSLAVSGGKNMNDGKTKVGQKRMWDLNSQSESFAWSMISFLPSFPPCMVLHFSQWHPWISNRKHEWALVTGYRETERWVVQMLKGRIERLRGGWRGSSSSVAQDKLSCSSELHNHMLLRWLTALTFLQLLLYLSVSLSLYLAPVLRSAQLLCPSPRDRELFRVAAWCYFGPHRFRRRDADVR